MKRTCSLLVVLAIAALLVTGLNAGEKKEKKISLKGIKCIVSGKQAVDKEGSSVAVKGGKVFFCCANCPGAYKKDTAKFAAKANHQLAATKQAKLQKCVLTGKNLNPATKIKVSGVDICFCCNGCKGKATKATGAAQIALLFNDKAFAKGYTVGKPKKK